MCVPVALHVCVQMSMSRICVHAHDHVCVCLPHIDGSCRVIVLQGRTQSTQRIINTRDVFAKPYSICVVVVDRAPFLPNGTSEPLSAVRNLPHREVRSIKSNVAQRAVQSVRVTNTPSANKAWQNLRQTLQVAGTGLVYDMR